MEQQDKYKWMKPFQRELFDSLVKEFGFKNLTDIGNFLGLNNPYHGAKLIFEAQKQNLYLRKIIEIKRLSNQKIEYLESIVNQVNQFKSSIDGSLENLTTCLYSIKEIKNRINN